MNNTKGNPTMRFITNDQIVYPAVDAEEAALWLAMLQHGYIGGGQTYA